MKITLFTSNHPRHLALVERLQKICEELFVVVESKTVFPGKVKDTEQKSPVMEQYFARVQAAEQHFFGPPSFCERRAKILNVKSGDLSVAGKDILSDGLNSDYYVVFGASYIRGWLVDFLVENKAINIHMGVSPYYRGSSSNFWALYDKRPELVGATIHMLSRGLDSGEILFHAMPLPKTHNPFEYSMRAVLAAHVSLTERIAAGEIFNLPKLMQDKSVEMRYTKHSDFTDAVASEFLSRDAVNADLIAQMQRNPTPELIHPVYY